ncbi:hypothetical protein SARC_03050 [Sphaeroforma arctica JP610]|uniref:FYVE-type domain-containing protein n=1 Tax=Sphaeroforma arctica JP610 TaxID=667725 RepID=A0A0L0G917_9EUKA|nr:hypothetical protein SARC_03050 [Sphaeroforma arctica JP610]KNC84738.1 hypothetical protein SARC_03050 [Sphaeroforma arctica JP610]|eukprot:XP_014158640.1 hypothetical protein SARC_03050 [Sphaeroforma arctica JP610]
MNFQTTARVARIDHSLPGFGECVAILYSDKKRSSATSNQGENLSVEVPSSAFPPQTPKDQVDGVLKAIDDCSDELKDLHSAIRKGLGAQQGIEAAQQAGRIGLHFIPGGPAITLGAGVALFGTGSASKAIADKLAITSKLEETGQNIGRVLMTANKDALERARQNDDSTFLQLSYFEQPVSLNDVQAAGLMLQLNPGATSELRKKILSKAMDDVKNNAEQAENRFPVASMINKQSEHAVCPDMPDYNPPVYQEEPLPPVFEVKKRDGQVKPVGTILLTAKNAIFKVPIAMIKHSKAHKAAKANTEHGMPALGDFVIRRGLMLTRTQTTKVDNKLQSTLIMLPPVWDSWNPNCQDLPMLLAPPVLNSRNNPELMKTLGASLDGFVHKGEYDFAHGTGRLQPDTQSSSYVPIRLLPECERENPDLAKKCAVCSKDFGIVLSKHNCRACGKVVCDLCSKNRVALEGVPSRVCNSCIVTSGTIDPAMGLEAPMPSVQSEGRRGRRGRNQQPQTTGGRR